MNKIYKLLTIFLIAIMFFSVINVSASQDHQENDPCLMVSGGRVCMYYIPDITETPTEAPTETQLFFPTSTNIVTPTITPTPFDGITHINGRYTIGQYEPNGTNPIQWDEFTGTTEPNMEFILGLNGYSNIKQWIGHSTCSGCNSGITNKQSFIFANLIPETEYLFTIIPGYVSSSVLYTATILGGQILQGENKSWSEGYKTNINSWDIVFTASSSNVTLTLGNSLTSGLNYLYFDVFYFTNPSFVVNINNFEELIIAGDGDWWGFDLWEPNGTYRWGEGYVMDSYLSMYEVTDNTYWLDRYITHADLVLSQRNNGPVWNELSTGYPWNGFAGAMTFSMGRFAEITQRDGLEMYSAKSLEYATAARDAVQFFDVDWRSSGVYGWWIYGENNPSVSLRGQQAAYDMQALLATTALHLSNYDGLGVDTRLQMLDKATRYAQTFKTKLVDHGSFYLWDFAYYSPGLLQDVGHGNFDILFVYRAYENNIIYTQADMVKFSNTFNLFFRSDSTIPNNLIGGLSSVPGVVTSQIYWTYLQNFDPIIKLKLQGYANPAWVEMISIYTHQQ